jgi:carbamate kinase
VEANVIRELVNAGIIVIAGGGGGIPVYSIDNGDMEGFDAVVDKDFASAIIANEIESRDFFILTDVRTVFLNFGQKNEAPIHRMTMRDAKKHLKDGQFAPGTMEPKISAAVNFIKRGGERVLISAIDSVAEALSGQTGTVITNQS